MTQLSTTHTTYVTHLIGALEIGSLPGIDDGVLEAAQPPMTPHFPPTSVVCRHVDDGALEAAGPTPHAPPTVFLPCRHVDDGALEAASGMVAGPTSSNAGCRNSIMICVDDGRLA